jgi:hypothetical protein
MTGRELIFEIYREADFVTQSTVARFSLETAQEMVEYQSSMNIMRACSAFLNGQDVEPHINKFVRKDLEINACEELEIWGKFSPPDQFINYEDDAQ